MRRITDLDISYSFNISVPFGKWEIKSVTKGLQLKLTVLENCQMLPGERGVGEKKMLVY